MEQREAIAAIILNNKNEVLLQKKDLGHPWTPGKWCFFGGKLENGKNPKEVIKELIKNKAGIEVSIGELFKKYSFEIQSQNGIINCTDYIYTGKFEDNLSDIKISEGAGFVFLDKSELTSHPLTEHSLELLKEYFELKQD
jgi:8-oxo-dGTP pyrophosphatase MutT (NUDIX family)